MTIARYIVHRDVPLYQKHGWHCQFLRVRGDDMHCYLATFMCCEAR